MAVLELLDLEGRLIRADRGLEDAPVLAALTDLVALDLQHARDPFGMATGVRDEFPDDAYGRVDVCLTPEDRHRLVALPEKDH